MSTVKSGQIYSTKTNSLSWRPDAATWNFIKITSGNDSVFFTVAGPGTKTLGKQFTSGKSVFCFSPDSVGAPVFYRAVPLPFSYALKHVDEIEWYLGGVQDKEPKKMLSNIPVCANCHSFSKDGMSFAMDIDYANDKGSYVISGMADTISLTPDKIISWSNYKREDGERTYGLLSSISPDGRYVLSTVKDRSVFVPVDNLMYSQLFFPIKGIVAIYDRDKKTFYALSGADDKSMVQSNPNWSPDGKEIIYARAPRYHTTAIDNTQDIVINPEDVTEFLTGKTDFKFDLYRMDFNDGAGGEPIPVPGASQNNMSNFFARYSPNGKWIVFCQSENFMLLQPDSKLYIMPAAGGTPRLMKCNTSNMNSWHSWSPNSKWLVFTSKQKGAYTQLYLTHIDDEGNDSPAVLLDNLIFPKKAINIPEFVDTRKHQLRQMADNFSRNAPYYTTMAANNFEDRKFLTGLENLKRAVEADSNFFDAYLTRLIVYNRLGQSGTQNYQHDKQTALRIIDGQIRKNPTDPTLLIKRAQLKNLVNDKESALQDVLKAVHINPDDYNGLYLLASIYRTRGESQKTLECYQKMLKLHPGDKQISYYLALHYISNDNIQQAQQILNNLIQKYPANVDFYFTRSNLLFMKGDFKGSEADLNNAIKQYPENFEGYLKRGLLWNETGQKEKALADMKKALELINQAIEENPENLEYLAFRPEILEQTGNLAQALTVCQKFLAVMPLNYKVLKLKARLEKSLGQWPESIITLTTLIDHFPPESGFYTDRASAWLQTNHKQEALDDLKQTFKLSPGSMSLLFNIANLEGAMGDEKAALRDLGKVKTTLTAKKQKGSLSNSESELLVKVTNQLNQLN